MRNAFLFENPLVEGLIRKKPNRFILQVELDSRICDCHCPTTGRIGNIVLTQAARYERSEERQGYRSGHYSRHLTTTSGDGTLNVPRLKGISFETAIIERYRRRVSSVEEALIKMHLAGVSLRRVEDVIEALWGSKVSPSTISELNKKAYVHIENWRTRPLQGGKYPYVYADGYREVLGAAGEIRRHTRVVGCFPNGNLALMLVCARLRHVAGTQWGNKKYINMKHLEAAIHDGSIAS